MEIVHRARPATCSSSRSGRCLPCLETLTAERPKVRPAKEDRAKKARDLTGTIRCRARALECQRVRRWWLLLEIFSNICIIDDSDEWGQWRQTVMSTRRSHFPLGSFSPKTHEKMAFTEAPSISRRPIASAGAPLALLYILRDGKISLETSTCRLTPFTHD